MHRPLVPLSSMQLLVRIGFALIAGVYFSLHVPGHLMVDRIYVVLIGLLFCVTYTSLQAYSRKRKKPDLAVVASIWLDIGGSMFLWFIDPISPSPMVVLIIIAALGNGVHNGFFAFRRIFRGMLVFAPILYTARTLAHGFDPTELIFLSLGSFLMIYLYLVISKVNSLQDRTLEKTGEIAKTNQQLVRTGMALQESETRYRSIFEDSGAATILVEEKSTLINLANSKFEQLTGYSRKELCNKKRLTELLDANDMDKINRFFHGRFKKPGDSKTPFEFECRLVDRHFNVKHVIVRFGTNVWHERFIITVEDITASRQSQMALQKYNARLLEIAEKLRKSRQHYRNLFENTGTATILVEKNLRISMANTKFEELTGHSRKEVLDKKRLTEFIEKKSLFRIRRYHERRKKSNLPLPNEYECLIQDASKHLKHVVMKVYTPPGEENSIVSFFDITARKQAEEQLHTAHERLKVMAVSDELTGLANRRHFNTCLIREWNRSMREGIPLSLIMLDVDYFKPYNDTYGHQSGDRCLWRIARAITSGTKRAVDLASRYGGEEFAVIMPNTDISGSLKVAEKIRAEVENMKIAHAASPISDFVTVSLGIGTVSHSSDESFEELVKRADNALYAAKENGRNRISTRSSGNTVILEKAQTGNDKTGNVLQLQAGIVRSGGSTEV